MASNTITVAPGLPAGSVPGYFTTKDPYPTTIDTSNLPSQDWSNALWVDALLSAINKLQGSGAKAIPITANNIDSFLRIMQDESTGQEGGFLRDNNPLNLNTWAKPHASEANGKIVTMLGANGETVYVQQFNTIQDGIEATANEFLQSNNAAALKVLQSNGSASMFGAALGAPGASWASGPYASAQGILKYPATIAFGSGDTIAQNNASATGGANAESDGLPGNPNATSLAGLVPGLSGLLGDLTSISTWKNVGIFVLGLGMVLGGAVIFLSTTKEGQGAAKAAVAAA